MTFLARLSDKQKIHLAVVVAALGYFVDTFDIQLFSVVRVASLKDLGLSPEEITRAGVLLINWQMAGMLLGGLLWGVLGDRKGRTRVMFGSILLYSLGSIANAFVTTIPAYAALRFLTGMGLAGEIGAGITLVSEILPKETRGYATTLVGACGVAGVAVAALMSDYLDWRVAYIVGGVLGLLLLVMRVAVNESGMFNAMAEAGSVACGHFWQLFTKRARFWRYIGCIAVGMPMWFVASILGVFAPEIAKGVGITDPVKVSTTLLVTTLAMAAGGAANGLISQWVKSRKRAIMLFLTGCIVTTVLMLFGIGLSAQGYYILMGVNGFFIGYWTVLLATTAEQFGTNLRTTATSTVTNLIRATVILDTTLITALTPSIGFLNSVKITAVLCFALGAVALWRLPETYARDLEFVEE